MNQQLQFVSSIGNLLNPKTRCYALSLLLAVLAAGSYTELAYTAVLFELRVDPGVNPPFYDATGRHTVVSEALPAGTQSLPSGGSAVASSVLTPDGSRAAFLTGAWLEILSDSTSASDFLFADYQDLTIELWFMSNGNGAYDDDPSNEDRMHALGFGDLDNNLDLDLGDKDPPSGSQDSTAAWTYYGSGGSNAIVHSSTNRTLYFDDQWHKFKLIRDDSIAVVYIDDQLIGSDDGFGDPLGSDSTTARNFIGRASLFTDHVISGMSGRFPWFGYIGGVRVSDEAIPPDSTVGLLFEMVVDSLGATPFFDSTGRHSLEVGGLPGGDPNLPPSGGTVEPTTVLAPNGATSAFFIGGWLEILSSSSTSADFLFAEDQNLTIDFWFKSDGNDDYSNHPDYDDRMHAIGFGDALNNLDVDLGDGDPAPYNETALWTYFGSEGAYAVTDPIASHGRNYYLDGKWHNYTMVREGSSVTVYIDGLKLGSTSYGGPLGSFSVSAKNFIGRASLRTYEEFAPDDGIFPWFGYISSVRVYNEAITPPKIVPTLEDVRLPVVFILLTIVATRYIRRSKRPLNKA